MIEQAGTHLLKTSKKVTVGVLDHKYGEHVALTADKGMDVVRKKTNHEKKKNRRSKKLNKQTFFSHQNKIGWRSWISNVLYISNRIEITCKKKYS